MGETGPDRDSKAQTFSLRVWVPALLKAGLDVALPALCLSCRKRVDAHGGLCHQCWGGLKFLSAPQCGQCGTPFEVALGESLICGACLADPPPLLQARAAVAYDDASKPIILALKHADRLELAPMMAKMMLAQGRDVFEGADRLIPVPLHWLRRLRRRSNQAAELARALARYSGVPFGPGLLFRKRATESQGGMPTPHARKRNVSGAFAVRNAQAIAGLKLVLVDDVYTTGSTLSACAKALLKAGASQVSAVTFARVVRPAQVGL